jgi:hypothetical protein
MSTSEFPARVILPLLLLWPLACRDPAEIVITQEDQDQVTKDVGAFNKDIQQLVNPRSSDIPWAQLRQTQSYKDLIRHDAKLLPYLIRQRQLEEEGRVLVGSALADRKITGLDDLERFQKERATRLTSGVTPWLHWPGLWMLDDTSAGIAITKELGPDSGRKGHSWIQWWADNQHRYEFRTKKPITISTQYAFSSRPHVSTEATGNLLTIEAVSATYQQIIERAAAELGVDVFIGEQQYMDILTMVRMRAVTFDEFAYLIGHTASVNRFHYERTAGGYHFGGPAKAKPRIIMSGWGIAMEQTVFAQGQDIPVIVVARGLGEMVDPSDPAFPSYGSFRITDNAGNVVKDYLPQTKEAPTVPLLQKMSDGTRLNVVVVGGGLLKPGEYNATFRYLDSETPSIAFEVYAKNRNIRDQDAQRGDPVRGTDPANVLRMKAVG